MKKYTDAQRKAKVDLTDFDKTYVTPQSVLTQDEIDSINKVNPKFFDTFKASVQTLWTQEKSNKQEFQDTQAYSKVYTKDVEVVKKAGMYSIDEMSDPNKWTPDDSEIKFAHDKGLTLNAYNNYMKEFATGQNATAYTDSRPMAFNQTDNQEDIDRFKDDLILAGYNPNAYTFSKEKSGVWSFVRDNSVPLARDAERASKMQYINQTLGTAAIDTVSKSFLPDTISNLMKHALAVNTFSVSTDNTSLQQFWEAYSRPDYNTQGYTHPLNLQETLNPDGSVTETGTVRGVTQTVTLTAKQEAELANARSLGVRGDTDLDTVRLYRQMKEPFRNTAEYEAQQTARNTQQTAEMTAEKTAAEDTQDALDNLEGLLESRN